MFTEKENQIAEEKGYTSAQKMLEDRPLALQPDDCLSSMNLYSALGLIKPDSLWEILSDQQKQIIAACFATCVVREQRLRE